MMRGRRFPLNDSMACLGSTDLVLHPSCDTVSNTLSNQIGSNQTGSSSAGPRDNRFASRRVCRWCYAFAPSILLWSAFAPLAWWPVAWIAPVGWLRLARGGIEDRRRFYGMLYLAGLLHWMLLIQWVRLPHWSAYFGWIALSAYLALYLPAFVAVVRQLVIGRGISLLLAAPAAWVGLEWVRAHLLTGFAISLLGHTQTSWLDLLQVADLGGAYAVSFVVLSGAAVLETLWWHIAHRPPATESLAKEMATPERSGTRRRTSSPGDRWRGLLGPLGYGLLLIAATVGYGRWRIEQLEQLPVQSTLRVALIQGCFDTAFDGDAERARKAFYQYVRLSRQAVTEHPRVQLLVWPESMYSLTEPIVSSEADAPVPADWQGTAEELTEQIRRLSEHNRQKAKWLAAQLGRPLLVGAGWEHLGPQGFEQYNAAVLISDEGEIVGRYDKMHPVMFGEYVPLGSWFPFLYRLTPMRSGLTPGRQPESFQVAGVRVMPNICFENTVPHLIRQCVDRLTQQQSPPEVLVTITNDGWFWGSSLLDAHLRCGLFRAIEMRRPMLIAANTGFSAAIDATGREQARGPRRAEAVIAVDVSTRSADSFYRRTGDLFAIACVCLVAGVVMVPIGR